METEYHTWGWKGISARDLESWVPAYGKWCGPGWSAGERIKTIENRHKEVGPATIPGTNKVSPIDALCKEHDLEYQEATGTIDEKARKLAADIVLLEQLARLDKSKLTAEEKQYCFMMEYLFNLLTILPRLVLPEESYTQKVSLDEETQKQIEKAAQTLFEESAKRIDELVKIAKQTSNKVFEFAFPEMKREMEKKHADFMKDIAQKKQKHPQAKKQTKIPESPPQQFSEYDEKLGASANILGNIMTPEKLFNGGRKIHEHIFASTQQRNFVQDSIDAVLHATHTHQYDPTDFDFLFKNAEIFSNEDKESLDQKTSEGYTVRARSRNYV